MCDVGFSQYIVGYLMWGMRELFLLSFETFFRGRTGLVYECMGMGYVDIDLMDGWGEEGEDRKGVEWSGVGMCVDADDRYSCGVDVVCVESMLTRTRCEVLDVYAMVCCGLCCASPVLSCVRSDAP
jgi:hypothetical protein